MPQTNLICVVSGGCIPTTHLRIEKALQRFHDSDAGLFVLDGFNGGFKNDEGFKGESWRDDERLKDIYHELEGINKLVLYAKNTVENGVELRKVLTYSPYKKGEVVTSDTHFIRLVRIFYSVFPEEELKNLSFCRCREPNKEIAKTRALYESLEYPLTEIMLAGIKRGDPRIAEIYDKRRYGGIIGKTLSVLKPIIEKN